MPLLVSITFPDIGNQIGLGEADLATVIVRVIQLVLGFAPLLAVVMIILGGFLWMTSAGDEERLLRAKRMISGAVVGLIVVILAWAIVTFFARTALNVSS